MLNGGWGGSVVSCPAGADSATVLDGFSITGGAGQWEIWTDDQDGRGQLAETCATAYQLRVYDSLLRLGGEALYGDLIERTIYNTLFAAQSPEGRRIRYYSPIEGPREYHPGDTYCCPGNYRRIVSELPEMIYYRSGEGVLVNLYTPSTASLQAGGARLRLTQRTAYPSSGEVDLGLELSRPARFPLRLLRVPQLQLAPAELPARDDVRPATGARQRVDIERHRVFARTHHDLPLVLGHSVSVPAPPGLPAGLVSRYSNAICR